jgi:NADH oxidase (H2O2-forming)
MLNVSPSGHRLRTRRLLVGKRIVIVGGGAAGIGAAGAAKGTDPTAEVTVFTEYQDAAYSPCGIPYVHGKEIPDFERLFLGTKQQYADQGIDIRYSTRVDGYDLASSTVRVGGRTEPFDALVVATGWNYAKPDVPGADLSGLYYLKNIREAMEWDKVLDSVRTAVVLEAGPLGMEMVTALAHRGIETHLVDPTPWALSMATDPDIAKPVEDSWVEMGVKLHFNTKLEAILGDASGAVRGVRTSDGEIACQLVVVATHKVPDTALGAAAGLKVGSAGGFVVDETMRTSTAGVWAAGDCIEVPHGVSNVPCRACRAATRTRRARSRGPTPPAGVAATSRCTCPGGWSPGSG